MPKLTAHESVEGNGIDLPKGWTIARIGDVTVSKVDQPGPGKGPNFTYIDISSVDNERKCIAAPRMVSTQAAPSRAKQLVHSGDVLVSMTRPNLNAVALVGAELDGSIASTGFDVLRSIETIPDWLFLVVRSEAFIESMTALVQGALYPAVRPRDVRGFEFLLPPLPEQKRIVAKVETLLERVNAARARLARLPVILKRFRQSVLAAACSGQLTTDWRGAHPELTITRNALAKHFADRKKQYPKYKQPRNASEECPIELPVEWTWASIEELASGEPRAMQSGPFGSNLLHSEFQSTGVLAIGIDNVQDGWFSSGAEHRISNKKFKTLAKYAARPRDVLITVMGTVGRVCVIPEDIETAIITKHVYRISVDQAICVPEYAAIALRDNSVVQPQIQGSVIGQTRPGINGRILKGIGIPIPPLREQSEVVRRVDSLFALADGIEAHVSAATEWVERLPQAIIARAFRGELVPIEADLAAKEGRDYETAERLIARIREEVARRIPQRITRSRRTTQRKAAMKQVDKARVLEAIEGMPSEIFAFDELKAKVPGDYDGLKDILFALLDDPQSGIVQVFDKRTKGICFRRLRANP